MDLGILGMSGGGSGARVIPSLEYTPEKSIDFLGISCYNKNPGT